MAACYDQDNNEHPQLFPCDGVDGLHQCCYPGETCASNGLCGAADENAITPYFAHGCVVEDWDSPTCIPQCLPSDGVGVDTCRDGEFCCYGLNGCNCSDPNQVFSIDPVRIVYLIPHDTARTPTGTSSTAASTTSSEIREASTTTESSITSVPTLSSTNSDGTAPTVSATSDQTPSNDDSLTIGLGVGLGVGLPLAAGVIGLIWFLQKRRSSNPAGPSQSGAFNHAGMPQMTKATNVAHELHNQTAPQELSNYQYLPRPMYAGNNPHELSNYRPQ